MIRQCCVSLRLLLFQLFFSSQCHADASPDLRVNQGAQEDDGSAHPVPGGEGVPEVEDGEDEADELPQCDHQGHSERGTLCGQDEHAADTHVSEEKVKDCKRVMMIVFNKNVMLFFVRGGSSISLHEYYIQSYMFKVNVHSLLVCREQ